MHQLQFFVYFVRGSRTKYFFGNLVTNTPPSILMNMNAHMPPSPPASIDGLEFIMISSTASAVDPMSPTRFLYRQKGKMIWGEYVGDTVSIGRFTGRIDANRVHIRFAHDLIAGGYATGMAVSVLERRNDGLLYLVEEFEKDGNVHSSICVEAETNGPWPQLRPAESILDGRSFVLESSTASEVDPDGPTRFSYREYNGVVWGSYSGDTVSDGHFAGVLEQNVLREGFVHHEVSTGATLVGSSETAVQRRADGRLELVEDFELDGVRGRSVCVEMDALA